MFEPIASDQAHVIRVELALRRFIAQQGPAPEGDRRVDDHRLDMGVRCGTAITPAVEVHVGGAVEHQQIFVAGRHARYGRSRSAGLICGVSGTLSSVPVIEKKGICTSANAASVEPRNGGEGLKAIAAFTRGSV